MRLCSGLTHFGVTTGSEASCEIATDVEFDVGVGHEKCLRIGIDRDKFNAFETGIDHAVDGIDSTAADSDDFHHC